MELAFKIIFFLAIIVLIITIIGLFLLLVKILFIFFPEGITIMGIEMTRAM